MSSIKCPHCGKHVTEVEQVIEKFQRQYDEVDQALQEIWDELKLDRNLEAFHDEETD